MRKIIVVLFAVMFAVSPVFAATQAETAHFRNVSVTTTPDTEAPDVTLNGGDVYVSGTLEVDSTLRFDGAVTNNAAVTNGTTLTQTGVATFNATPVMTYGLTTSTVVASGDIRANSTITAQGVATFNATPVMTYGLTSSTGVYSGAVTAASLDLSGVIQTGSGNHDLTNAAGLIDGEKIQDDTIDDDSIDFADVTGADLTLTDCGTITASGNITAGPQYGSVDGDSNTHYRVFISTELADAEEYTLLSSGKAGAFTVHMGTFSVFGTHTSAGAVTLTTQSSPATSTANDNAATVNVYDGGTAAIIENRSGLTLRAWIEYFWQN